MSWSRGQNRVRLGLLALLHLGSIVIDPRSPCEAQQLGLIGDRRATADSYDVQTRRASERRLILQVPPGGRFNGGRGCRSAAQCRCESGRVAGEIVIDLRADTGACLPVDRDERAPHRRGQDNRERDCQPGAQPELPDCRMRKPTSGRRLPPGGVAVTVGRAATVAVAYRDASRTLGLTKESVSRSG